MRELTGFGSSELDPAGRELTGTGVGRGAAVGPVARMGDPLPAPSAAPSTRSPRDELATARSAMVDVAADLRRRSELAHGDARDVLDAQSLMAEDPAVDAKVTTAIEAGATAAHAVYVAFGEYRELLAAASEYLAARVADLDDVRQRVVAACLGVAVPGVPDPGFPFVLVARDLAPADTAQLDLTRVLALVTANGGPTSHTAILARSRGIPAVVGCAGAEELTDGLIVRVDASAGSVNVAPAGGSAGAVATAASAAGVPGCAVSAGAVPAGAVSGGPAAGATADGRAIALLANVGAPAEVAAALAAGAEGIGLLRTEFLFLDARTPPTAAEQERAYRAVFAAFAGRKVTVRVLDAGADKPLAFLPATEEPNPALGLRGLRALQAHPDVLDTQLTAIAAAATGSDAEVWVMAPMISDAADADWFVARAREHGLHRAGAMIEVPSAALTADAVLAAVTFASIGTNDLAQYALAADRLVGALAGRQDPWHPAVLRLVELVGSAAARAGKPVGVCGEAAADPLLACVLVGLGVTSLSMAPGSLADVRTELARRGHDECRRLARRALAASTAAEARARAADLTR